MDNRRGEKSARIIALAHAIQEGYFDPSDNAPCRFIVPEALIERQVKILLAQPKRRLERM